MDHVYLSMDFGEKVKIDRASSSIVWAVAFGNNDGTAMVLSTDQTYLFASATFPGKNILGKLSLSDGSVISSYSPSKYVYYLYLIVSDSRALCFTEQNVF